MAGLAAAILLKRAGQDVLVLDKEKSPGFKPCAGGVTPRAMGLAKKLDLDLGALNHLYVMENNTPPWHYNRFETRLPLMSVADRQVIDKTMWDNAKNAGVRILNAKVNGVDFHKGKFLIKTTRNDYQSEMLIGADGATSLVRRAFGSRVPLLARAAMYRRIETKKYHDRIIFDGGYIDRGYGWVFPTGDGAVNAGVYVIEKFSGLKLRRSLRQYALDRFGIEPPRDEVTGGIIPWGGHTRPAKGVPVLLTGDAGGFADPLTGEGIYHAMYTGAAAAEAIISSDQKSVRAAYYRSILPLRANSAMLRIACPIAHTPQGARIGARLLSKRFIHGPAAEGLIRGFNSSSIAPAYPWLAAVHLTNPKLIGHRHRVRTPLAEHSEMEF